MRLEHLLSGEDDVRKRKERKAAGKMKVELRPRLLYYVSVFLGIDEAGQRHHPPSVSRGISSAG